MTEDKPVGLDGDENKDGPEGLDIAVNKDKPVGLDGNGTEDEPVGLGKDVNKVKEVNQRYTRPVNTKEKENPNETEAKYQAKTGIGTNGRQEDKETEAKDPAKAEAKVQDEAKYQSHQAVNKTHTSTLDKNLAEKKETEAKHHAKPEAKEQDEAKYDETPTGMLVKNHV